MIIDTSCSDSPGNLYSLVRFIGMRRSWQHGTMIHRLAILIAGGSLLATGAPFGARGEEAGAARALSFEDDVVPLLEARCFKCHGAETRKAGLDLRRRFSLIKGGDSGAAIVPGKPDDSLLVEMISKKEMPPKEEDPLDARQIDLLRRWVAAGAPIRGKEEAPLEATDADQPVSDEDRNFWAYR